MLLEGEIVFLVAIYYAYQGKIALLNTICVAMAGMFIGDILWYSFGSYLDRIPFMKKYVDKIIAVLDMQIRKRPVVSIVFSKFTYGFHRLTLLRAKVVGVPLRTFMKIDAIGVIIWTFVIGNLVYILSASLPILKKSFRFAELGLALIAIIYFIIVYLISRYSKKVLQISNGNDFNNQKNI
ncbi:MAG: VTT domain-containing protein, partial [bacterium]